MIARVLRVSIGIAALLALAGVALLVFWVRAGQAEAPAEATWQRLDSGRFPHTAVTALACDPSQASTLYVGTAGPDGLWTSHDGGVTGLPAGGSLAGQAIYAILPPPEGGGPVFAGAADGLYASADHGNTWSPVAGVPDITIYALARDASGRVLAAGAGPTVYRGAPGGPGDSAQVQPQARLEPSNHAESSPAGAWQWSVLSPLTGVEDVLALAARPQGGLLLAGTGGAGLFRSDDDGSTWSSVPEIDSGFVAELAFAGDGGQALARTRSGLYASGDGGMTWRQTATNVPGRIDAFGFFGTGPGLTPYAGAGDGRFYRRDAASGAWQPWGSGLGRPGLLSAVAECGGDPGRIYAGTDRGLYLGTDFGLTWQAAAGGPGQAAAKSVLVAGDGTLFVGDDDGVYASTDGGEHWQPRQAGLPADAVLALANGEPSAPQLLYAGLGAAGLYRSADAGAHWAATSWTARGVPALAVDPRDPRHLFVRALYERIYESHDGGLSWRSRWTGMDFSTQVISLALDSAHPGTLYAGGTEGFYRSADGASSWQPEGAELAGQSIFAIALDPAGGPGIFAGATNGLYRSQDGGSSWGRWGRGLEDITVTALQFDRPQGIIYAGTKYRGVYASRDGGSNWQAIGPGPVSVNGLALSADGLWLFAATEGGFFRTAAK